MMRQAVRAALGYVAEANNNPSGREIGKTKSGKPVFEKNPDGGWADSFNEEDHEDAVKLLTKEMRKAPQADEHGGRRLYMQFKMGVKWHRDQATQKGLKKMFGEDVELPRTVQLVLSNPGATIAAKDLTHDVAKSRAKQMRSDGIFASIFHASGPKTGPKSKWLIVVQKKKDTH